MERRTFLSLSATGTALLFLPFGCSRGGAGETAVAIGDDQTFLFFDGAGGRMEIEPLRYRLSLRAPTGEVRALLGGLGASLGRFNLPVAIAVGADGLLYVVDRGNSRIQVLDGDGRALRQIGAHGGGDGQLHFPSDVAVDAAGRVLVSDTLNHRVAIFDRGGGWLGQIGVAPETPASALPLPRGIAIDADGLVHVVDGWNGRVDVYGSDGSRVRRYGAEAGMLRPHAIAIDPFGRSWVGDVTAAQLHTFAADGSYLGARPIERGGRPVAPVQMSFSPDGTLFVAAA